MAFTGQLAIADSRLGNIELAGPVTLTTGPPPLPRAVFEMNLSDDPTTIEFPSTGYTDLTGRLRGFSTRRGRSNTVGRVEGGTATVTLDNRDGYLNPGQPGVLLLRRARLSAVYDGTAYRIFTGHVESYEYSYPGVDKDAIVTLSIADGLKVLALQAFDKLFTAAAEVPSVRVASCLTAAGIGTSFQSVVSVDDTYRIAPVAATLPETPATTTKAATLADGSATVTVADTTGLTVGMPVSAPGIPAGATILSVTDSTHFVLTAVCYLSRTKTVRGDPASSRSTLYDISDTSDLSVGMKVDPAALIRDTNSNQIFLPAGGYTITGIDSNSVTFTPAYPAGHTWGAPGADTRNCNFTASASVTITIPSTQLQVNGVLDHIRQIENSERGLLVIGKAGDYIYQGSNYRPSLSAVFTFGENTGAGEVPYEEVPLTYDDTGVANEYDLHNIYNQTETLVTDLTSQARYFKRHEDIEQVFYENVTKLPDDQRIFEPIPRLEGLRVSPRADPLRLWPLTLARDVSDKVNVRRRPLGGADILSAYVQHIEGVEHDASPVDWRIKFVTSPVRT